MKVFAWKINLKKTKNIKKNKKINKFNINLIIFAMLLTVFAFSYAGGTLQVFNKTNGESAIYQGNTLSNNISLMINVYWGDEFLKPMLETLNNAGVKTTFFVGGVWASKNADMLNLILSYGNELANHGYYHKDSNKISEVENFNEISQTHQIVKSLTGIEMSLFAPPSGAYNQTTVNVAASLGYKTIMWTRDTIDWRDKDENLIYSRAVKDAKGGDLVLMHPTECTKNALPKIIATLQDKGLNITTVSETLA